MSCITVTHRHSGVMPAEPYGPHSWQNYCPLCHRSGHLRDNPKRVPEGEVTCYKASGGCDADYDGNNGWEKAYKPRARLVPCSGAAQSYDDYIPTPLPPQYKETVEPRQPLKFNWVDGNTGASLSELGSGGSGSGGGTSGGGSAVSYDNAVFGEPVKIYEDPYLKVRVDHLVREYLHHEDLTTWTKSAAISNANGWSDDPRSVGRSWVGNNGTTGNLCNLTKTINVPFTGYYQMTTMIFYCSSHNGTITLYIDNRMVEDAKPLYDKYRHSSYVRYKPYYLTKGNHTFKIAYVNGGWFSDFDIIPIVRYEGDSLGNKYTSEQGFNIKTAEFTKNSVAETNQLTLTTDMQDNYWNHEPGIDRPVVFDWTDHITLWLGEDYNSTTVMFGGYCFPSGISKDGVLELKAVDRMYDLQRASLTSNTTGMIGSGGFPSTYELTKYLATVATFPVKSYSVPYDYGFYNDFSTTTNFSDVTVTGWTKTHDVFVNSSNVGFGNPAPSLKLTYTGGSTPATCQLYLNTTNPYDAAVYDKLNIDYYYATGSTTPFPFNIHIKMHTAGETVGSALHYVLQFTGGTETIKLGDTIPCGVGGNWHSISVNLKTLFSAIIPSSNYYVSDIHLSGTITTGQPLWIDQVMGYRDLNTSPKYNNTDLKNYLEVLKDVCDKTNHSAYIQPGELRADDYMVIIPNNTAVSLSSVEESNLVEFGGWSSDPLSDNFCNWFTGTFTDEGGTEYTSLNRDFYSCWKYGDSQDVNSVDAKDRASADSYTGNYVTDHAYPTYGFTIKTHGLADIIPQQYVYVNLPRWNIIGNYPNKSITYTYDRDSSPHITTSIDFNRPSKRFRNWIRETRSDVRLLNSRSNAIGLFTVGL